MTTEGTVAQVLAGEARWAVVHGDCLDVLPTIPDRAIDHIITDPPYSKRVHTGARTTHYSDTDKNPACAIRAHEMGFEYLNPKLRRGFARQAGRLARRWVLAFSDFECVHWLRIAFEAGGLRHFRIGVWDKLETGSPQFNGCGPGNWGEAIEIAHGPQPMRWSSGGARGVWRHITALARGGSGRVPRSDGGDRHRTEKPESLMLELLTDFSDLGDLILDPFAGSGTTGALALRVDRRVLLIERDQRWAEFCRERLRAEERGLSLTASRAGQESLFR